MRDLQDERRQQPQAALRLPRHVARQQQVHLAEAHVDHQRVLIAHAQRQARRGRGTEHVEPHAVPVEASASRHGEAVHVGRAEGRIEPLPRSDHGARAGPSHEDSTRNARSRKGTPPA